MPSAVLEAMACEKAVVATPVGGIVDVVKDSETGLIVPANDAEALSNAILKLLDDQPLRSRLGKSAREVIQREFMLQKELDLFFRSPHGFDLGLSGQGVFPAVNLFSDKDGIVVRAEVPGVEPSAIEVQIDGQTISCDDRRVKGIHANAAMRVDPALGDVCLSDPAGASAVFYDTYVTVSKA